MLRRRASSAIGTGPRSPWWRSSTSALSAYGDFVVIEIIAPADHCRNGELWLRNTSGCRPRTAECLNPTPLGGDQNRLGAVHCAELAVHVVQVGPDGAGRQAELGSDLLVDHS